MPQADVAIVGGGVVGCAIAYFLTELGNASVVLIERERIASGATAVCPGGIRQQFEGEADCRLAQHAVRFFEEIERRLAPPHPLVFDRSGYLFLAESEEMLARYATNVRMQRSLGIPSALLEPADVRRLVPALAAGELRGGAYCAADGFLEDCQGVAMAFAARARARGSHLIVDRALAIERVGDSWRVRGDRTTVEAGSVIVAAGAESAALVRTAGSEVPIARQRRRLAFSAPAAQLLARPLVVALERGFAVKQLGSGVAYMGWLGERSDVDDLTFVEETLQRGVGLFPALESLEVRHVMGGDYDLTPDRRPLIGELPGRERLFIAAGFSGHGFMVAPAAAEAVARLVYGEPGPVPLDAFSPARFGREAPPESLII